MKLLFPKELIDENLEGFKEKVTRTLKLFPKAVVPRDIHGEIVYPAVNHPPDTHCKEKRLGGSRCLLSPSSPERQALQIEGEKGVKTQSAPKHWPRTRKKFWPSNSIWPTTVEPGRKAVLGRSLLRDRNVRAHARTGKKAAIGRIFVSERTDRAGRSGKQTIGLGRNLSPRIWPTKSLDRENPSAIGPKLF
ncbi:unnamed protein product [Microthlaspi erraticum]|uniref:Uncharacterized protein n=1 Tax=Microthlaspi erraticum TaxID=1685480 RepID=A0A6D2HXD3_9BRAS|nr:unnamed protein product [Microthlaspi erraticum]